MALSGSFHTSGWTSSTGDSVSLKFSWTAQQDHAGNTSTISWSLTGSRATDHMVMAGGFRVVIDGQTVYDKSTDYRIELRNGTVVAGGSKVLTHNTDGTRTFQVSAQGGIYYYNVNCTGSATFTLDTIPRAATVDSFVSDTGYLDGLATLKYTPKSAAYYIRREDFIRTDGTLYRFYTADMGQKPAAAQTVRTQCTAQELDDIYSRIPGDAKTVTWRISLSTYADAGYTKQIGNTQYKELALAIPETDGTAPVITNMTLESVSELRSAFAGLYIQGKSRVKAAITAQARYNATVQATDLAVEDNWQGALESGVLTASGQVKITGRATDSRGFHGCDTQSITVIPYAKPRLLPMDGESSVFCARCDSEGNPTDDGTFLKIRAKRGYSYVNANGVQKNFCQIRYRYKEENAQNYCEWVTLLEREDTGSDFVDSAPIENVCPLVTASYRVQIGVVDDVGEESAPMTFIIPTDSVTYHERAGGKGAAFGKYAQEDDLLDVAWNARIRGDLRLGENETLMDFVVEQGTVEAQTATEGVSILWSYRKWHSGIAECWGLYPIAGADISKAWGSLYETEAFYSADFPAGLFADVPAVEYTVQRASPYAVLCLQTLGGSTKETTCQIFPVRATSATVDLTVSIMARGKWNNTKEE